MSETNYASYVTIQDTDLKSAQTGSIKEDPNQEKTKGSTGRKARDSETNVIFEPPIWVTHLKGAQVQCTTRGEHTTHPVLALEGSIQTTSIRTIFRKMPMGPHNRIKRRLQTKERKDLSLITPATEYIGRMDQRTAQ